MALIKCPECNNEVSDKALNCPHCGYPLKKNKRLLDQQKDLPDFSKMEVLLYRGVKKSLYIWTLIVGPIVVFLLVLIGILLMFEGSGVSKTLACIWFIVASLYVPLFIIMGIKFHNNNKLTHQNLYYDKDNQKFYLECWDYRIISIDAHEDIRVGNHMLGFNETVVVHQGRRINTGFSTSDLNAANQRIQQIRGSLNEKV